MRIDFKDFLGNEFRGPIRHGSIEGKSDFDILLSAKSMGKD